MQTQTRHFDRLGGTEGAKELATAALQRMPAPLLKGVKRPPLKTQLARLIEAALGGPRAFDGAIAPLLGAEGALEAVLEATSAVLAESGCDEAVLRRLRAAAAPQRVAAAAGELDGMFRLLVDQTPRCLVLLAPDLTIRYMNAASLEGFAALEQQLLIKAETLVGQSIEVLFDAPARARAILSNPANLPQRLYVKLGEETLELAASAITGSDGRFAGTLINWQVVTRAQRLMEGLGEAIRTLAATATGLADRTSHLNQLSEATTQQANLVAAASEQTHLNVQTVATSSEELSISIREIARNLQESTQLTRSSVERAQSANYLIAQLGTSSTEIGKVVKVINSIARQTNLLALNATIEAARAGEAGRGFAVVASEVNNLAKETARATGDISSKIETIQRDTQTAVAAISEIVGAISQINNIMMTISVAIDQQAITTKEISSNVLETADGTNEVVRNITAVAENAHQVLFSTESLLAAEREIGVTAERLDELLSALTERQVA